MNAKYKINKIFSKLLDRPIYVNILAVFVLLCLIVYTVLKCVDIYTNHNKEVMVPDAKGLQIEEAAPFFKKNMLKYVVVDSTYSKEVSPGAIVEMIPGVNSKVKKNRVVYITVNAKTEKKIAIPDIEDISYRQALALLRSRGFMDIEIKYVLGAYRDLTVGVQYGGQMVKGGTRVPVNAKLILVISDGYMSHNQGDNTDINIESKEIEENESLF
jgi:beta-lactam-binding protein with PASTA domain